MVALEYDEPVPAIPVLEVPEKPNLSLKPDPSQKPSREDPKYDLDDGVLFSLFPCLKEKKLQELEDQYKADLKDYQECVARWKQLDIDYHERDDQVRQAHADDMLQYRENERQYQSRRAAFLERAASHNARVGIERSGYEQGQPGTVAKAMTRVLMNSELPADFPDAVDVEFDQENGLLRVARELPQLEDMPHIKGYRLIKKDAALKEQTMSDAARKRLYDGVVYQMALRTVHELLKGDNAGHVRSVEVLGVVDGYDPATGQPGRLVLSRLRADRERFAGLRLENVDPEICFKDLGGITSGRPSNLRIMEVLPELKG